MQKEDDLSVFCATFDLLTNFSNVFDALKKAGESDTGTRHDAKEIYGVIRYRNREKHWCFRTYLTGSLLL